MARVVWHGDEVTRRVEDDVIRRLTMAAGYLEGQVKRMIGEPGPTRTHPGQSPSAPGEPPHRRTGRLRASIAHEVERSPTALARVGTNLEYAKYLELGTKRMSARPFLRPALDQNRGAIARMLGSGRG